MKRLQLILFLTIPFFGISQNKKCESPNSLFHYVIDMDTECNDVINNSVILNIELVKNKNRKHIYERLDERYDYLQIITENSESIKLSNIENYSQKITVNYFDKISIQGVCSESFSEKVEIKGMKLIKPYWNLKERITSDLYPDYQIRFRGKLMNWDNWIIHYFLKQKQLEERNELFIGNFNVLSDLKIDENDNDIEIFNDKYLVPYKYKPMIEFSDVNSFDDLELFIKITKCLGGDGIIVSNTVRSKLINTKEISNPIESIIGGEKSIYERVYTNEDIKEYKFVLIKKDKSIRTTKDNLDKYDLLLKLSELKEKGIITQEEFDIEKKKLLVD